MRLNPADRLAEPTYRLEEPKDCSRREPGDLARMDQLWGVYRVGCCQSFAYFTSATRAHEYCQMLNIDEILESERGAHRQYLRELFKHEQREQNTADKIEATDTP